MTQRLVTQVRSGDPAEGLRVLADGLRSTGQFAEAQAVIDEMLALCARTGEAWCLPELLRLSGEIRRDQGLGAEAEQTFLQSLDMAGLQGALAWELRTTTSLARTWAETGRAAQARQSLSLVLARFSEGFDTADYRAASALLAQLGG